jgi:hypothetical protein
MSFAFDHNTYSNDAVQFSKYIRGVTSNFDIITELLSVGCVNDTAIGEDFNERLLRTI